TASPPCLYEFLPSDHALPHLHSFPTRRSSDLAPPTKRATLLGGRSAGISVIAKIGYPEIHASPKATRDAPCDAADRISSQAFSVDRKSTRLNSSHVKISYAVFCLKKKTERTPA